MDYQEPFRHTKEEYVRDIDVLDAYYEQLTHYIHNSCGGEYSVEAIKANIFEMFKKGGELEHEFPMCRILVRNQTTGDREEKSVPIDKLFRTVIEKQLISAPSLTFYLPEHIKRSKLSEFMEMNVAKRAVVKGEMFAAKAAGDVVMHINKKNEQNAVKTLNNGSSGAFSSPYTILYNQSSHSTLTSTCRTATSFGNAANERLLGGTRHYDCPRRVIDHFLSIGTLTNFHEFRETVERYNIHIPTVDEVMDVITHSSSLYFINPEGLARIRQYVENCPELERAAFVYMGDLFHLAKYNDELVRGMIAALIKKDTVDEVSDWDAALKTIDGDMKIIVSQFRMDIVPVGKAFGDVRKKDKATGKPLPWDQQDDFKELIKTGLFLQKTIGQYANLYKTILTNKNVPINIARMPDAIRRIGVVSDTDSTMMTTQWWAQWFTKGQYHGEEATRVSDLMIYLATQHLRHLMATMSVNMGVATERIFLYAMKNEFKFASFALTNKAKHYFSLITGQEGQLLTDPELEVKGVSLRTSNIPPAIMAEFRKTIKNLCKVVADGEKIEIIPLLMRVAELEDIVSSSIHNGSAEYLKTTNIKERAAYNEKDEKNYHYHRMYNEIFGAKYGYLNEPPYDAVKLPVNLETKTAVNDWISSIEDPIIKAGAERWFESTGFRTYKTLILPEHLVSNFGIPADLLKCVNARRSAFATVEPYYHILECLGVFMIDDNRTRLLSDYYGEAINDDKHVPFTLEDAA